MASKKNKAESRGARSSGDATRYIDRLNQSFEQLEARIDRAAEKKKAEEEAAKKPKTTFQAAAKRKQFLLNVVDSEWWFCVSFWNRAQKIAFLNAVWPDVRTEDPNTGLLADKYIDGIDLAEKLGVKLPPGQLPPEQAKINPALAALSMTVEEAKALQKKKKRKQQALDSSARLGIESIRRAAGGRPK